MSLRAYLGADAHGDFAALSQDGRVMALERGTPFSDALVLFDEVLRAAGRDKKDVKEIAVDRGPGGFSRVRRRVAAAAALAGALGAGLAGCGPLTAEETAALPADAFGDEVVIPLYDRAPNITRPKRKTTL